LTPFLLDPSIFSITFAIAVTRKNTKALSRAMIVNASNNPSIVESHGFPPLLEEHKDYKAVVKTQSILEMYAFRSEIARKAEKLSLRVKIADNS